MAASTGSVPPYCSTAPPSTEEEEDSPRACAVAVAAEGEPLPPCISARCSWDCGREGGTPAAAAAAAAARSALLEEALRMPCEPG